MLKRTFAKNVYSPLAGRRSGILLATTRRYSILPAYSNRVSNGKKVWCRSTRCVTVRSHLRCLRSSKCIPSPLPDSVHVSANASTATSSVPLCHFPPTKTRALSRPCLAEASASAVLLLRSRQAFGFSLPHSTPRYIL